MRTTTLLVASLGQSLMGLSSPVTADMPQDWQLSHSGFPSPPCLPVEAPPHVGAGETGVCPQTHS